MKILKKKELLALTSIFCLLLLPQIVDAHPGRTDSSGCHTCRTNCSSWGLSTGEYHCHRSKGVSQPVEPIKSIYGESGTGYTTPAPEYKEPAPTTSKTKTTITPKPTTSNQNPVPEIKPQTIKKKSWLSRLFSWFK
jgi:hypothetical protein